MFRSSPRILQTERLCQWRIQAKASMAPSCLVQSSIAAKQGNTHSRKLFMVSSVAILLSTPTQRAAMWRTAVYGCCRQVNKWGRCSSSYIYKTKWCQWNLNPSLFKKNGLINWSILPKAWVREPWLQPWLPVLAESWPIPELQCLPSPAGPAYLQHMIQSNHCAHPDQHGILKDIKRIMLVKEGSLSCNWLLTLQTLYRFSFPRHPQISLKI